MWSHLSSVQIEKRKLELLKKSKKRREASWALDVLGALAASEGDLEEAREFWRQGFQLELSSGDLEFSPWINPDADLEKLAASSLNPNEEIREMVARNPALNHEIFKTLSVDSSFMVRSNLASNPSCPLEILATLANDESLAVRLEVARNPFTPPEVLDSLLKDSDEQVRKLASAHPDAKEH